MTKKKHYYIAHVLFENGYKSVLALESFEKDEEIIRLCYESWSRAFIGMELKILKLCSLPFCLAFIKGSVLTSLLTMELTFSNE